MAVRFEEGVFPYQPSEILHLRPIGRYHAHVDALLEQSAPAYLVEVGGENGDGELSLSAVYPAEVLAHKLLFALERGGVYPRHGAVEVEYSTVFYLRCGGYPSLIEPFVGEPHYVLVHAVLHGEQRHRLRLALHDALHERRAQSAFQRGYALDGGRKLAVVACEHHTRRPAYGYPARRLESLRRLVDEECAELHAFQQPACRPCERGCYHPCLA